MCYACGMNEQTKTQASETDEITYVKIAFDVPVEQYFNLLAYLMLVEDDGFTVEKFAELAFLDKILSRTIRTIHAL